MKSLLIFKQMIYRCFVTAVVIQLSIVLSRPLIMKTAMIIQ